MFKFFLEVPDMRQGKNAAFSFNCCGYSAVAGTSAPNVIQVDTTGQVVSISMLSVGRLGIAL